MKIKKFKVNGETALVADSALDGQLLPPPEAGDVGKVPTVQSDGSYALANAGGGSSPLVVTFSGTTDGGDAACDKTWAEIDAADTIQIRWINEDDEYWYANTIDGRNVTGGYAWVGGTFVDPGAVLHILTIVPNGTVDIRETGLMISQH